MTTWTKQKLGDVCIQITDGKHGDCKNQNDSGYYFISSKDVHDGSIHYENARQITQVDFTETHRRTRLQVGDVLITNSGTIGRMALIKNDHRIEKTTFQKSVAVIKPDQEIIDNSFLYYYLLSRFTDLINLGGGSAQHNLLLGDLRKFNILAPDINTQKHISNVISSYDTLIKNNEKRVRVLEEMAQRLYTEWFVKFKFPGYEKEEIISGLPKGWEYKRIDEVGKVIRGTSYSSEQISDDYGDYYLVNLKSFNRGGGFRYDGEKYFSGTINTNQLLIQGDIVVAVTDMTTDRAVIARPARIPHIKNQKVTFSADVVRIISENLPPTFLYYCLLDYRFTETTKHKANGANVLHLKPQAISEYKILAPSADLMEKFENTCLVMSNLIDKLSEKNEKLTKMRDLLIPQLISGRKELLQ